MESEAPISKTFSTALQVEERDVVLTLHSIEYHNALQLAVYVDQPRLGSMTLGYPMLGDVEQQVIFSGKNQQLADMISLYVVRKVDKMAYCSVHLPDDLPVSFDLLKELLQQFLDNREEQSSQN